ncbi:30S ribosomal protein S4 [Christensenella tenuis]|jgi:small subunit ribosomal protein S4|uniref:Small ribosomal subunit protein uS4 n=1 Tax=Christensenella tenuis TaxID=2763033 RepID=A0ABR7EHI7_9FIRM|nr:30S ribosomal protein S4 [Christensenella tenuis]MBC5648604.1 30S ribosomal protein S4 [Christensenella tenuis]
MARYTGPVCRLCRREGAKLFLKGDRCYSQKCAFTLRPNAPGQHGAGRRGKMSEYGTQLREKQKVKRAYGILESQFRKYFDIAAKMKGKAGENLLQLLERRLDNVCFRLGIGDSRAQARQLVMHGHVLVNGHKVDIPSYLVDAGDVITIAQRSASQEYFKTLKEEGGKGVPKWLEFDVAELTGKVAALPERDDIDLTIEEHLIVELYSK